MEITLGEFMLILFFSLSLLAVTLGGLAYRLSCFIERRRKK